MVFFMAAQVYQNSNSSHYLDFQHLLHHFFSFVIFIFLLLIFCIQFLSCFSPFLRQTLYYFPSLLFFSILSPFIFFFYFYLVSSFNPFHFHSPFSHIYFIFPFSFSFLSIFLFPMTYVFTHRFLFYFLIFIFFHFFLSSSPFSPSLFSYFPFLLSFPQFLHTACFIPLCLSPYPLLLLSSLLSHPERILLFSFHPFPAKTPVRLNVLCKCGMQQSKKTDGEQPALGKSSWDKLTPTYLPFKIFFFLLSYESTCIRICLFVFLLRKLC